MAEIFAFLVFLVILKLFTGKWFAPTRIYFRNTEKSSDEPGSGCAQIAIRGLVLIVLLAIALSLLVRAPSYF